MIVNQNNLTDIYPEWKNIKQRILLLTVWNLDGTTSESKFYFPVFCWNGDDSGRMAMHLMEWVKEMSRYHWKISHYEVNQGCVYQDGREEIFGSGWGRHEIPTGRLYKRGTSGKWITPEQADKDHQRMMQKYYNKQMSKGYQAMSHERHPHKPRAGSKIYLN